MTIADDYLANSVARPYQEIRDSVRDGDLLMCSAWDAGSRMIRWATRSPWSHCALAFRLTEIGRVLALECVETIGVRAVPLSGFIARTSSGTEPYPGRIVLARHDQLAGRDGPTPIKAMSGFAFDRLGDKFSNRETARIGLRIVLGRFGVVTPQRLRPRDEYVCSEYIARCFDQVGIQIAWDGLGFIAPSDIARDPHVQPVAEVQTRRHS